MSPWLIGKMLSPFFVLLLAAVVLIPCRRALRLHMREGRLKRLLLSESASLRLGFLFAVVIALTLLGPHLGLY